MKDKPLCVCCLSEECFKDVTNEYFYGSEEESERYDKIMVDTFGIEVQSNTTRCLICEECVSRLREAAVFKQQCLKAQAAMKDKTIWLKNDIDSVKKIELKVLKHEDVDFDDKLSDCITDDCLYYILNGRKEKIAIQPKTEVSDDEDYDRLIVSPQNTIPEIPVRQYVASEKKSVQIGRKRKTSESRAQIAKKNKTEEDYELKEEYETFEEIEEDDSKKQNLSELAHNSLMLLQHSNICLFRSHRPKFGCYLCRTQFFNVTELRAHSETHSNEFKNISLRFKQLKGLSYRNVDISNLKCKICVQPSNNLIELTKHLQTNHWVTFKGVATQNFLIPYNLETFQCVLCDTKFNSFLRVAIHMNTHYANNVCENCGSTFINRLSLRTHLQTMHKEKKCPKCPAIFYTIYDRVKHLRKHHNQSSYRRNCLLCEKKFRYTYELDLHKIEVHGAERPTPLTCDECKKTFPNPAGLRTHVRSVHRKERNYSCLICSMSFFTTTDQKRHERTHENHGSFSCSYCTTTFKSKDSWRRHLKRQHGHVFEPIYNCYKNVTKALSEGEKSPPEG